MQSNSPLPYAVRIFYGRRCSSFYPGRSYVQRQRELLPRLHAEQIRFESGIPGTIDWLFEARGVETKWCVSPSCFDGSISSMTDGYSAFAHKVTEVPGFDPIGLDSLVPRALHCVKKQRDQRDRIEHIIESNPGHPRQPHDASTGGLYVQTIYEIEYTSKVLKKIYWESVQGCILQRSSQLSLSALPPTPLVIEEKPLIRQRSLPKLQTLPRHAGHQSEPFLLVLWPVCPKRHVCR